MNAFKYLQVLIFILKKQYECGKNVYNIYMKEMGESFRSGENAKKLEEIIPERDAEEECRCNASRIYASDRR